jgi:hypothetical protein
VCRADIGHRAAAGGERELVVQGWEADGPATAILRLKL